jgi:ankyrin repeat protein
MLKHRGCFPLEDNLRAWFCPPDVVCNGRRVVLNFILDEGYQINEIDNDNRTLLHIAAREGHKEVALLLIDRGADMSAKACKMLTPLHEAAANGYEGLVQLLLDRGADRSAEMDDWRTP